MKPPIFIGGAGRSGTTLLRVMLDSHPNICSPVEFKMLPEIMTLYDKHRKTYPGNVQAWGHDYTSLKTCYHDFIMSLFDKAGNGKRIAEKTPNNIYKFWILNEVFPDSPLIQVIRDGRDVCASLFDVRAVDPETHKYLDYCLYPKEAALYWKQSVMLGRWGIERIGKNYMENYYEVRYEDLIRDTEATLRKLFSFINEPWSDAVLEYYQVNRDFHGEASANQANKNIYTTSIGRYKTCLSKENLRIFETYAGDLLKQLDY